MLQVIQRHGTLLGGVVISGMVCLAARPFLLTARGASGPTLLQAQSAAGALLAMVVCVALATAVAVVVARVINTAVGLFVLGAGIFILARRLATVEELVFSNGSLALVALETIVFAAITFGSTIVVFRLGGPLRDIQPKHAGDPVEGPWSADAWVMAASGLVVLPIVWLLAKSPTPGQVLATTFIGGMVAGLVGRLLRPNVQPVLLFVSPVLFGAIGHAIAMATTSDPIEMAFVDGRLSPFGMPRPIDYAAGSLMGVAVGLGWAKSFLTHEEEE